MNPLITKLRNKIPGKTFQLPSKGLFYTDEFAEHIQNGEVHFRPMSSFDEITMRNGDLIFDGSAISQVFDNCVDGIIHPENLLKNDVDAMMVFLRIVTYGNIFNFSAKHNCENSKPHDYSLDLNTIISNMVYISVLMITLFIYQMNNQYNYNHIVLKISLNC